MKAIIVYPGKEGVYVKDLPENQIENGKVVVKTLYNGICGTDRGIVTDKIKFARAPANSEYLILGHEALGTVKDPGSSKILKRGDLVVPIVRRGCGKCSNCLNGRQDFCETGEFTEAGIRGLHGFMREEFTDDEINLVKVPDYIRDTAVLIEPLTNMIKAVDEIQTLQKRSIWNCKDYTYHCRNAAVIGTGATGLLTAILFKTIGFNVSVINRREATKLEMNFLDRIEVEYVDSEKYLGTLPDLDVLLDTSGVPSAVFPLLGKLKKNGAVTFFGTTSGTSYPITGEMITYIVENNILLFGSVNAIKTHFEDAAKYIELWNAEYGSLLNTLITDKFKPENSLAAIAKKQEGEIKTVIDWTY